MYGNCMAASGSREKTTEMQDSFHVMRQSFIKQSQQEREACQTQVQKRLHNICTWSLVDFFTPKIDDREENDCRFKTAMLSKISHAFAL